MSVRLIMVVLAVLSLTAGCGGDPGGAREVTPSGSRPTSNSTDAPAKAPRAIATH